MITPPLVTIVGVVLAALLALAAWASTAWRWRHRFKLPEAVTAAALGMALAAGMAVHVRLFDLRPLAWLAILVALHGAGRQLGAQKRPLTVLAVSAPFLGGLPVAAALVPHTRDARQAARLTLFCSALSAMGPFGPVQWMCGSALDWLGFALVPGALAAAVAWPGNPPPTHEPTPMHPWTWLRLARWALAVWVMGAVVHGTGVSLLLADALSERPMPVPPAGFYGLGLAAGAIADPWLLASVLERVHSLGQPPGLSLRPLVLGIALAPVLPLALAATVHGREVWKFGAPIAAVQLAIALVWIVI